MNTGDSDHFGVLGLPRGYDLDEAALRRAFLSKSREVHPDAVAGGGDEDDADAQRRSAAVNEAYETLRDPVRRAEYLLLSSGGKTAAQDKRVPQEILNQTLMLREEIDDARAAGDRAVLDRILAEVLQQKQQAEDRIADLARGVAAGAGDRDALRLELNSIRYLVNLLGQV